MRKSRQYPKAVRKLKWALLAGLTLLLGLNMAFPPPVERAYETSIVVTDHDGEWLSTFPISGHRWRLRAELDEIDPRFIRALLALEDKRFVHHSGVDIPAVLRALRSWQREGQPVSGASTLTMQLARQLEPRPRTLRSKFIEMLRAMQIEARLSKREILTLYLTHTPYGGNVEGLAAATHVYFGKTPDHLTDSEIALLLALPQAPEARRPDRHPKAAKQGRDKVLRRLYQAGLLDQKHYNEARQAAIPAMRQTFPQTAWLTAGRLKQHAGRNGRVRTTLDYDIQGAAERLARTYTQDRQSNVAILVVENASMKVRASVGSAGRDRPGGWIDMTDRLRSPGSTLKPFIYGLAFDDGLSTPGSFILDAPTRFGSYRPENFNRRYHGDVRVYEALAHSLNVPAVLALDKIGIERFAATLQLAGADLVV
ncbi:MAG TPA: penicillin-binding protein 1C, partial [Hellea balneolensis]|nr:penicillin-binding protein 1C [Hellea balneolensis]